MRGKVHLLWKCQNFVSKAKINVYLKEKIIGEVSLLKNRIR